MQTVALPSTCSFKRAQEQGAKAPLVVTKSLHTSNVADAVLELREILSCSSCLSRISAVQVLAGVRSVYTSLPNTVAQGEASYAQLPPLDGLCRRLQAMPLPAVEAQDGSENPWHLHPCLRGIDGAKGDSL